MFDYTVSTEKTLDQAIIDLKHALGELKFGVLWEMDIPTKLQEKGVTFEGQFRILEVCNPQRAKAVLEMNLRVGYFLPCKIVVYVDEGITKIGMAKPAAMIALLGDNRLTSEATEVERDLVAAIDRAK